MNCKNCYFFLYVGLLRQPKWGHLKDLHRAIKLSEPALVSGDPTVTSLGNYQEVKWISVYYESVLIRSYFRLPQLKLTPKISFFLVQAHVFKSKSGACAAFLANYNPRTFAKVAFGNMHYNLPPWSISILPDCKNTVYNTARVRKKAFDTLCWISLVMVVSTRDLLWSEHIHATLKKYLWFTTKNAYVSSMPLPNKFWFLWIFIRGYCKIRSYSHMILMFSISLLCVF